MSLVEIDGVADMKTYSVEEAQNCLSELLAAAHLGDDILIHGNQGRAMKLLPTIIAQDKPLQAGSAKGLIRMAEDFDAPLAEFDDCRA